jgi:hypothetical protein
MGTVPRQESISRYLLNVSSGTSKMALLICLCQLFFTRALILEICNDPSRVVFLRRNLPGEEYVILNLVLDFKISRRCDMTRN